MSHDNYRNRMNEKRLFPKSMLANKNKSITESTRPTVPYITQRGHTGTVEIKPARAKGASYAFFNAPHNGRKDHRYVQVWTSDEDGRTTRAIHDHETGDIIQHSARAGTDNNNLYALEDNSYWAKHKSLLDAEQATQSIDALVAKARQARKHTMDQWQARSTGEHVYDNE